MAFTTPASFTAVKKSQLLLPPLAAEPLKTALANANYLWSFHSPPLLSVAYTSDPQVTRATVYHIPIMPSADGLRYQFEHRFVCSAAAQNITVSVDTCTVYAGGATVWTNILSEIATTGLAGALHRHTSATAAVAANIVAIRVGYSAPAAGNRTDHHLVVYPSGNAITAGIKPSGFVPTDDTLISSGNRAAIHEEWINRCAGNANAVLRDRYQCAFAFVQEYTATPRFQCTTTDYALPKVRAYLPYVPVKTGTNITIKAIGTVTAGATANRIELDSVYKGEVKLAASGNIETATLPIGVIGAQAKTETTFLLSASATAGNTTNIYAVVGFWLPEAQPTTLVEWTDPPPPASVSLLAAACQAVDRACLLPYAGTGHLFDGSLPNLTTRYLGIRFGLGVEAFRCALTETVNVNTNGAAGIYHEITSGSMAGKKAVQAWSHYPTPTATPTPGFSGADDNSLIVVTTWQEQFGIGGWTQGESALKATSQDTPYTEGVSVTYANGFAVQPSRLVADPETL